MFDLIIKEGANMLGLVFKDMTIINHFNLEQNAKSNIDGHKPHVFFRYHSENTEGNCIFVPLNLLNDRQEEELLKRGAYKAIAVVVGYQTKSVIEKNFSSHARYMSYLPQRITYLVTSPEFEMSLLKSRLDFA